MAKKYKLRHFFSLEMKDGTVIVGPALVELTDAQFAGEKHKLEDHVEEVSSDDKASSEAAEEKAADEKPAESKKKGKK